jgi:hypothetical protein
VRLFASACEESRVELRTRLPTPCMSILSLIFICCALNTYILASQLGYPVLAATPSLDTEALFQQDNYEKYLQHQASKYPCDHWDIFCKALMAPLPYQQRRYSLVTMRRLVEANRAVPNAADTGTDHVARTIHLLCTAADTNTFRAIISYIGE